jgi:transcriptional regulator NrdR family protein
LFLTISIFANIEAMKYASENQRFEMMNQFKQELIKLQEEERLDAMRKLIMITESNNSEEVLAELKSENSDSNNKLEYEAINDLTEHIEDDIKNDVEENIEYEGEEYEKE